MSAGISIKAVQGMTSPLLQKLAQVAESRAGTRSDGTCLATVRSYLDVFNLGNQTRSGRAIDSVDRFRENPKFEEVKDVTRENLAQLPAGTVVITMHPSGMKKAGHAQIMIGGGRAASEFVHGLSVYRGATKFFAFIPKKGLEGKTFNDANAILSAEYGPSQIESNGVRVYGVAESLDSIRTFIKEYGERKNENAEEKKPLLDKLPFQHLELNKNRDALPVQPLSTRFMRSSNPSMFKGKENTTPKHFETKELESLIELSRVAQAAIKRQRESEKETVTFFSKK